MPRGDGKEPGAPRKNKKHTDAKQYIPEALAERQKAYDEGKPDQSFKRPGSQRKGNSN